MTPSRVAAAVLALLMAACLAFAVRFAAQLTTGAGVAAKQLCSLHFVSGLDPQRAREWYLDDLLRGADPIMGIAWDPGRESVSVGMLGVIRQTATHRPGYGCTLVHDERSALETPLHEAEASGEMLLDRGHRRSVFDEAALDDAMARAFQQDANRPPLNTLAVVVLHDGRLVAERYAEGITPETRLPG